MTTNYHDPILPGAPANAAIVEEPIAQLDEALTDLAAEVATLSGSLSTLSYSKIWLQTAAPTTSDDETQNIKAGDIWINTADTPNPSIYICGRATAGNAHWKVV